MANARAADRALRHDHHEARSGRSATAIRTSPQLTSGKPIDGKPPGTGPITAMPRARNPTLKLAPIAPTHDQHRNRNSGRVAGALSGSRRRRPRARDHRVGPGCPAAPRASSVSCLHGAMRYSHGESASCPGASRCPPDPDTGQKPDEHCPRQEIGEKPELENARQQTACAAVSSATIAHRAPCTASLRRRAPCRREPSREDSGRRRIGGDDQGGAKIRRPQTQRAAAGRCRAR